MPGGAPASRYETILKLASGGMATVYVGTVRGALGFRQLVAIKKPHTHLLEDRSFRSEIVAEARLASMIHHANVVDVRDVEIEGDSISLVMDYIEGASLGELIVATTQAGKPLPPRVAVRVAIDALAGLHAAHELVDERDRPVGLVHRDVSPQNILVGSDGMARVADFGVAKFARKNMASTSDGSLKGKLAYMAPEYLRGEAIDRRFDIFAMGVVLWEALAGRRCFRGENEAETLQRLLTHEPELISTVVPAIGAALDAIVTCALAKSRDERFMNAAAMGAALEGAAGGAGLLAGHAEVAATVKALVGEAIDKRRALVRAKLANEPSVASLMDVPALVKDAVATAAAAATVLTPPTKTAAVPATTLLAPMSAAPSTEVDVPPTRMVPMASSVAPSTMPTTPRMEGAPIAGKTLVSEASASMENAAVAAAHAAIANVVAKEVAAAKVAQVTHASAGVHTSVGSSGAMRVAEGATMRAAEASVGSVPDLSAEYTDRGSRGLPPRRRWVLPLAVGIVTAVVGAGAIRYGVALLGARADTTSEPTGPSTDAGVNVVASASTSASAGAVASTSGTTTATTGANPPASASASLVGAAPSASASAHGIGGKAGARPLHSAAPATTVHKPPPNPYAPQE